MGFKNFHRRHIHTLKILFGQRVKTFVSLLIGDIGYKNTFSYERQPTKMHLTARGLSLVRVGLGL